MELNRLTQEEVNTMIANHQHWLRGDCAGWEVMQANFSYTDLHGIEFNSANLSLAIFKDANLIHTNFEDANLSYTNFENALLIGANLFSANFNNANLRYANLGYANLEGANLYGTNLSQAKDVPYIPMVCPEEGLFVGYKKCEAIINGVYTYCIAKLEIPASAKRSSATTRKCRCDKAKVMSITSIDGTERIEEAKSFYDSNFIYKVGEVVEEPKFDDNRWNECSTGIHFFLNRQEAIDY